MAGIESPVTNCTDLHCQNDTFYMYSNDTYADYFYVDADVSFWQVPQLIILVVLFVFIVFGNVCVLVAIGLSQTGRKTRMNFFIVNLAISDLTVGVFHVTVDIAERCLVDWHGGSVLCKIVRFLQVFVVYASTFMIVSLSIDRVDAIARPMNFTRQATTVRALVNTAWITSGVLSIPSLLLFDTYDHTNGKQYCIMNLHETWHWQLYITLVALTAFIIPALIIIVCYGIIIFVIWNKGRGFHNTFQSASCRNTPFDQEASCRYEHVRGNRRQDIGSQAADGRNKGIIPQAKIKTLKMTLIIVCVFVFSWCPYFVFNLMDVYSSQSKSTAQYAVTSLVQSLAPLNSAANPIIYGIFGTRICQNLRRIPCVAYIYDWLCQCRIKQPILHFRNSQPPSEQTNLDVTSGKHGSMQRRNYRYLLKCNAAHDSLHHNTVPNSANTVSQNGINDKVENNMIQNDVTADDSTNVPKLFYRRRPSGLPLVNRKMTAQETILFETYRSTAERADNCNIACRQKLLSKEQCRFELKHKNYKHTNGQMTDIYETHFDKIDEGVSFEGSCDV